MTRTAAIRLTGILFLIGLCFLFLSPVSYQGAAANPTNGENAHTIHLARASFDPLTAIPSVPSRLAYNEQDSLSSGAYILQFIGPVTDEWKRQAAEAGAVLGPYVPQDAFIVRLDQAAIAQVKALPFVRWVGPYQPAYKLALGIDASVARTYRVILAPWSQPASAANRLAAFGTNLRLTDKSLAVDMSGQAIEQAARLGDVLWIEPVYLQKAYNDVAGGSIMNGSTAWANGYTGAGVTVAVTDTGLDTGDATTIHQDFAGRVTQAHIASKPVIAANYGVCGLITNAGADDGAADVNIGHGTHVTGSAAGSGARSSGSFKGLAYEATIVFQAVEQWTTWDCPPDGYALTGIPADIRTLLTEEYNWGARLQNDSWGGGAAGVYDQQAAYFDDFVYSHPDFSVVVAAGNAGEDVDNNGYVDNGSVNSPATAKNLIVVGASQNERTTGGYTGYTWSDLWPFSFGAAPTGTDVDSSSRDRMAAFSSRGPTSDLRIKPDVVAPGTDIISVRSSMAAETGWGTYNQYYEYMGGTSMASPLTTGAAAVVRQYYIVHEAVTDPSAALIKATLINTAVDIPGYGNTGQEAGQPIPNNSEGWGRVDVGVATTPGRKFVDGATGVSTSGTNTTSYSVFNGKPFKVTLVWSDYPGAAMASAALVNNLDLVVTAPDNVTTYNGNHFSGGWTISGGSPDTINNVESVYIQVPQAGVWKVQVKGTAVPQGSHQAYALVVDGDFHLPGNFTKTAPAKGATGQPLTATLTWGASALADSYAYCIDTINNAACDTGWVNSTTNTSVQPGGLANSTTYYWQARAHNTNGDSDADNGTWSSFTTLMLPPGAFQKTAPANGATGQPGNTQLIWSSSSGAASYDYCIDTSNDTVCDTGWIDNGSSTSVQPASLADGVTYFWQVYAHNTAADTYSDGGWYSFTAQVVPPGAFIKMAPAANGTGLPVDNLTLSWSSSPNAAYYQVCFDNSNNDTCNGLWANTNATSIQVGGMTRLTPYYWQVRAVNTAAMVDADNGSWWTFTTMPALPGGFNKVGPGSGATERPLDTVLSWGSSSGSDSYEVCVDAINNDACDGSWTPAPSNSLGLSGLTPATTYYWQVRARNAAGTVESANGWWTFTTRLYRFFNALVRH